MSETSASQRGGEEKGRGEGSEVQCGVGAVCAGRACRSFLSSPHTEPQAIDEDRPYTVRLIDTRYVSLLHLFLASVDTTALQQARWKMLHGGSVAGGCDGRALPSRGLLDLSSECECQQHQYWTASRQESVKCQTQQRMTVRVSRAKESGHAASMSTVPV